MLYCGPRLAVGLGRAPAVISPAFTTRHCARDTSRSGLQLNSLCLALLGQPSATSLCWGTANPRENGAVYRLGLACAPLDFVRWAHVSGRLVPAEATAGKELKDYFTGWNHNYTGPDAAGIYPLLKPATG